MLNWLRTWWTTPLYRESWPTREPRGRIHEDGQPLAQLLKDMHKRADLKIVPKGKR